MLPNDLNYLVSLEQHRDRLRELDRHQLIQLAGLQRPANPEIHRRAAAWIGGQMVRWGLALQGYERQPQQPSRAAIGGRAR